MRVTQEVEKTVRARHIEAMPSWDRVDSAHGGGYRGLMEVFLESPARLSCVSVEQRDLSATGRCATIYRAYREAVEPWVYSDGLVDILLPSGFEKVPCGGERCRTVSVSGSRCPAAAGRVPQPGHAHLRAADLAAVIGRMLPPRSKVALPHLDDGRCALVLCLLDVLLGAVGLTLKDTGGLDAIPAARRGLALLMDTAPTGKVCVASLQDGKQLLTAPLPLRHGDAEVFDPDDFPEGELI